MPNAIAAQQYLAVETALAEWMMDIRQTDPRVLSHYIRGENGIHWPRAERKGFLWCGAFAGYCHGPASGAGLDHEIRQHIMPSTVRLFNAYHNNVRHISNKDIQPGDVVVVTNDLSKIKGTHICLCVNREGELIYTVEGNARGLIPSGSGIGTGVVKATRPLGRRDGGMGIDRRAECPLTGLAVTHEVIHAYRFLPEDYHPASV